MRLRRNRGLQRGKFVAPINPSRVVITTNGNGRRVNSGPSGGIVKSFNAPVAKGYRAIPRRGTDIMIHNREMVAQLTSTGTSFHLMYNVTINPGIFQSFPWMSPIANQYEYYEFTKLNYSFVPSVPTSASGNVYLAVDYDVADAPPISAMIMSSWQGTVSGNVWSPLNYSVRKEELARFRTERYVWDAATVPSGTDPRTYHFGHVYAAAEGVSAGVIGTIWVDYSVKLSVPELDLSNSSSSAQLQCNCTAADKANPYGSSSRTVISDLSYYNVTNTVVTLPAGTYTYKYHVGGTDVSSGISLSAGTGGSVSSQNNYAVGTTSAVYVAMLVVTAAYAAFTISTSGVTAISGAWLDISKYLF